MKELKQNERGAILIEVIAVIALLGVMGPLLFKQIIARNEEIENVNIATEVRTMKEGLAAYIMENKQTLLEACPNTGEGNSCFFTVAKTTIDTYLPVGYDRSDYFFFIDVNTKNTYPFVQGYVVPDYTAIPSTLKLKRAARIANLIGTDGGVFRAIEPNSSTYVINGTAGSWGIESNIPDALQDTLDSLLEADVITSMFLATTGMDTFIPQLEYEDFDTSAVILPDRLALENIHAWNYFSVGQATEGMTGGCYELNHTTMSGGTSSTTLENDVIYDVDQGPDVCDPLFWVGSLDSSRDGGNVYAKNNMHLGYHDSQATVSITTNTDTGITNESDINDLRGITVYDKDGLAKIKINANGEVMSLNKNNIASGRVISTDTDNDEQYEKITLKEGALHSNIVAPLTSTATSQEENYRVDPAYTSVMNDIKLDALLGNSVADLLKQAYLVKDMYTITGGSRETVSAPECPNGYAPAIMVTPTVYASEITQNDLESIANNLTASTTTGEISAGSMPSNKATLYVKIDNDATTHATGSNTTTSSWFVELGYDDTTRGLSDSDIKGIAQTYCVQDESVFNSYIDESTNPTIRQ